MALSAPADSILRAAKPLGGGGRKMRRIIISLSLSRSSSPHPSSSSSAFNHCKIVIPSLPFIPSFPYFRAGEGRANRSQNDEYPDHIGGLIAARGRDEEEEEEDGWDVSDRRKRKRRRVKFGRYSQKAEFFSYSLRLLSLYELLIPPRGRTRKPKFKFDLVGCCV